MPANEQFAASTIAGMPESEKACLRGSRLPQHHREQHHVQQARLQSYPWTAPSSRAGSPRTMTLTVSGYKRRASKARSTI